MSNRPIRTLHYYDKAEKREYEIGAIFKSDRFDWKADVAPSDGQTRNEKYPRMKASEAFARAERKEGYVSEKTPKQESMQSSNRQKTPINHGGDNFGEGDGFTDDTLPF